MNSVRLANESRGLRPPLNLLFQRRFANDLVVNKKVIGLNPPLIDSGF